MGGGTGGLNPTPKTAGRLGRLRAGETVFPSKEHPTDYPNQMINPETCIQITLQTEQAVLIYLGICMYA